MTFEEVLNESIAMVQRQGRVSYRALKRQFDLDDDYLTDLKDEMLYTQSEVVEDGKRGLVWTGEAPESAQPETDTEIQFHAALQVIAACLQSEGRITYRTLQDAFCFSDELLTEILEELYLRQVARDEGGNVLVWAGSETRTNESAAPSEPLQRDAPPDESVKGSEPTRRNPEAERRQLTVMFCDLVGSTDISGRLDPEDLREVVRAYQRTAAEVVERYDGHIAQYLGDGLLIYFGYPVAHEDDAQRAVYTGLGIVEAMSALNTGLESDYQVQLAVRIGIHTGPVVVGEMGESGRQELLALGETPNLAARLEALAEPNTVVMSDATRHLVQGTFTLELMGEHLLKGITTPIRVSRAIAPLETPDEADTGFNAHDVFLVGRDEELGLLRRRWEQVQAGRGQVILVSGEPGIGKSSLVRHVRAHAQTEGAQYISFRCSPYHKNSALYPVVTRVERLLQLHSDDGPETKLEKLENELAGYRFVLTDVVLLFAALLTIPLTERYPPLQLSPPQQKQQTLDTLVAWLLEETERQPILAAWEDLHWADATTLELLELLMAQSPTVSMMTVVTFRPEFHASWPARSHVTPIALKRLDQAQVEALTTHLTNGKLLPTGVIDHLVTRTDGVPLFVEELTKMLLESDLLVEQEDEYVLTGALDAVGIPVTLQDSLMARLDRLPIGREVAQLGAVIGREFTYEMIYAVTPMGEDTLGDGLDQLVEAELIYQRDRPPQSRYLFKHSLVQDVAYGSLLKRTRQHLHQRIAQQLEAKFSETVERQPELVAYHYAMAGCEAMALDYWEQAGQLATRQGSYEDAIAHYTHALALIPTLCETPECTEHELSLHLALSTPLMAVKGYAAPEVETTLLRARQLCEQLDDPKNMLSVLQRAWIMLYNRDLGSARELAEQILDLAQAQNDATSLMNAYKNLGVTSFNQGRLFETLDHLEKALSLYDPEQHRSASVLQDSQVTALAYLSWALACLGRLDQSRQRMQEALDVAHELAHPNTLAAALYYASLLHHFLREAPKSQSYGEALNKLRNEYDFGYLQVLNMPILGFALAQQGREAEGVALLREGIGRLQAQGTEVSREYYLTLLADIYSGQGQIEAGLEAVDDALKLIANVGETFSVAETYRIEGELLQQMGCDTAPMPRTAEASFQRAIDVARHQKAKLFELRASVSLARLWRNQGKLDAARELLTPIYNWIIEGFDTVDLQEASSLLDELGARP